VIALEVAEQESLEQLATRLQGLGLLRSPRWFAAFAAVFHPGLTPAAGSHLLRGDASPQELLLCLEASEHRPTVKVTLPEGWEMTKVATRLRDRGVCDAARFLGALREPALLTALGIQSASAEGYLFPSTYELPVDSAPSLVLRRLTEETRRRLQSARARHPGRYEALAEEFGWNEAQWLTLASVVEKEAQQREEQPLIAGVFFNRLRDPNFRPARYLQSDATARYPCVVAPETVASCAGYKGKVTPAMVRDANNPYNTYRHAGLPPGPIGNPGDGALEAVLVPAATDALFFVATGHGRHTFTRTLQEHEAAIEGHGPTDAP